MRSIAGLERVSIARPGYAVEYEFVAEKIEILAAFLQLLIEVWIVIRLPTELGDVEVWRYSQAAAEISYP